MNKRQFARVLSLYKDGVGFVPCSKAIMSMSKSKSEGCIWIGKLHDSVNEILLKELKDAKFKAKYPCDNCRPTPGKIILVDKMDGRWICTKCGRFVTDTLKEGGIYEPTYREKSTDLED